MDNLGGLAVGIATLCVVLTVAFLILAQARQQVANLETSGNTSATTSIALNATKTLTTSVADIPGWVKS